MPDAAGEHGHPCRQKSALDEGAFPSVLIPIVTGCGGSVRWCHDGQFAAIPVDGFYPDTLNIGQIIDVRERTVGFPVLNDCDGLLGTDPIDTPGKRFDISRIDIDRICQAYGRNRQQHCKAQQHGSDCEHTLDSFPLGSFLM
jgi:hypothetical protein